MKPPAEPEPDNPEPPADLAAHEQWLAKMRELGRRTLDALLEEEELKKPKDGKYESPAGPRG